MYANFINEQSDESLTQAVVFDFLFLDYIAYSRTQIFRERTIVLRNEILSLSHNQQ